MREYQIKPWDLDELTLPEVTLLLEDNQRPPPAPVTGVPAGDVKSWCLRMLRGK